MTPILCSALMLAAGLDETAKLVTLHALQEKAPQIIDAWLSGKDFIGLSEKEIIQRLGKPSSKQPGVWEYQDWNLGPGYHSFIRVRVIGFKDGRVVSAPLKMRGVG